MSETAFAKDLAVKASIAICSDSKGITIPPRNTIEHMENVIADAIVQARAEVAAQLETRDAEIKKLREALQKIEATPAWGWPDKFEITPAEVRFIARAALTEEQQ